MARGLFITGTDTDVGKTTVALGLMVALRNAGLTVAAMKPVSAGCIQTEHGLRNDDAVRLMQQASVEFPYEIVNPYAFESPIAPHIAAAECHIEIDRHVIEQAYQQIATHVDVVVVEGAGGWLVPINEHETMADIAKALSLAAITVVGIRLGCINHSLLTEKSILETGVVHYGWVANHLSQKMNYANENIEAIRSRMTGSFLGEVLYSENQTSENIAKQLDVKQILNISNSSNT